MMRRHQRSEQLRWRYFALGADAFSAQEEVAGKCISSWKTP